MVGQTVSHYEILSELGSGGMGEVYLARDLKLKRRVALKFLPKALTTDREARARFENEAQAAAALHHPNIVTIHDIDEHEGQVFIAMEHVEGRTLKELLLAGRLPARQAIAIAAQVAAALAAAHAKGIVHRDIKPANIIVACDGAAKIVDFGLAKLKGQMQLTRAGTTLGTVAYMSPELALGQEADARADIWSLGAVLYEMATGRLPFPGEYEQAIIYAILNSRPEPAAMLSPGVPPELALIIDACLEKAVKDRPQTAEEVAARLQSLTGTTGMEAPQRSRGGRGRKIIAAGAAAAILALAGFILFRSLASGRQPLDSLAVVPFASAAAGPDMDYLAEGIPAALVDTLGQLENLKVKSFLSASSYLRTGMDPVDIAKKLGVQAVLTGRIRPVGSDIVVAVELTAAGNGDHIWGKSFQHSLSEIIHLQQDLASDIGRELRVKLSGEEKRILAGQNNQDAEAYNLYLQGQHFRFIETDESLDKALSYYQQAVEKDPSLAQAWAGQSTVYLIQEFLEPAPEKRTLSRAAAEKAIAIAPDLAESNVALGVVQEIFDSDWQAAERSFKRAIALNPNLGIAHYEYGLLLGRRCRNEEAAVEFKKTIELEPLWSSGYDALGAIYTMQEKHSQAIAQYQKALEYSPGAHGPTIEIALELASMGYREKALALFKGEDNLERIWRDAIAGDREQLKKDILEYEKEQGDSAFKYSSLASIYIYLKEDEKAISAIETLYMKKSLLYLNFLSWYCVNPDMARLRANPRFAALLKKAGLPN